jgi:hypothetical protein
VSQIWDERPIIVVNVAHATCNHVLFAVHDATSERANIRSYSPGDRVETSAGILTRLFGFGVRYCVLHSCMSAMRCSLWYNRWFFSSTMTAKLVTTCCPSNTWAMLASGSIFTVRVAPMYSGGTLYQLLFTLTNASVDTRAGIGVRQSKLCFGSVVRNAFSWAKRSFRLSFKPPIVRTLISSIHSSAASFSSSRLTGRCFLSTQKLLS